MTTILNVNPKAPEPELIDQAAQYVLQGEVVVYPTETIYGLGADVLNRKAVKKIYELKQRDYGLPIALLVADIAMLKEYTTEIPERAFALIRRFWPGPLTILFEVNSKMPKGLVTNTNKIGVRISSHPVAAALVAKVGRPITTTSANLSDYPPSLNARHVQKFFGEKISCILNGGECEPSRGSTVVDVTDESMRIIRAGSVSIEEVIQVFQNN